MVVNYTSGIHAASVFMLNMNSDPILTYKPSTISRERERQGKSRCNIKPAQSCILWLNFSNICQGKKSFIIKSHTITLTSPPACTQIAHLLHDKATRKRTPVTHLQGVLNSLSACCAALCLPTVPHVLKLEPGCVQLANQR